MRPLVALPKAHLHLHLEGAMRPATLEDLVRCEPVVPLGHEPEPRPAWMAASVLTSTEQLRRLVDEVVADAAASGARWVEPSIDPRRHPPLGRPEAVLEAVLEALSCAGSRHRIGTGLMVSAQRADDPGEATDLARLAVRYGAEGVVSFGLDLDRARHPMAAYLDALATARAGGLLAAPCAGADDGPEQLADAVGPLAADRLQHALRAVEDPDLVVRLADVGTCLDVSPTTEVARGQLLSLGDHPIVDLLDAGVRCSLNAPDPLVFGTCLLEEYEMARRALGFDDHRLATIARTSIEASGAPDALKASAEDAVDAWLADDVGAAVA